MKPHILIIEDDIDIAENIRYNLERTGAFTSEIVLSGEEGLTAALGRKEDDGTEPPDLIILDLNLPQMSGFELCRRLRAEESTRKTPIIMLTARVDEADKVRGLELGADDYVTKPFGVRELIARVRAALRRSGLAAETTSTYDDGRLEVDYSNFTVSCDHVPVKLTRKEFALLALLVQNKGRVVQREHLLERVWGLQFYGDARTLDVHISGLRRKLGDCGAGIETVIGIGYRFRGCLPETEAGRDGEDPRVNS